MEFSRPEHWSGYPFPSPGDLPKPGIKPVLPVVEAWSLNHWTTREILIFFNFKISKISFKILKIIY